MSIEPLKTSGTNSGMSRNGRDHNSYGQFNVGITDALGTGSPVIFKLVGGRVTSGGEAFTHNDAAPFSFNEQGELRVDTELTVSGVEINNIKVYSTDGTVANTIYGKVDSNGVVWANVAQIGSTVTNVNGGNRDAGTQTITLADDDPAVADLDAISGLNVTRNASLIDISGNTAIIAGWDNAAGDGASVTGDVAHDEIDAGEPVKIGGKGLTSKPSAVANNDRVNAYFDEFGRLHTVNENSSVTAGGVNNVYFAKPNGLNADAVVAYATGSGVNVVGLPYTFTEFDINNIEQIPSGTSVDAVNWSDKSDFIVAGSTITVLGGATFVSTDKFVVTLTGDPRVENTPLSANQVIELSPLSEQFVGEVLVSGAALVSGNTFYYVDMSGYRKSSFQLEVDDIKAGSVEITFEGTVQDDGTAAASCVYQDITNDVFGIGSQFATSGGTISDMWVDNAEKTGGLKFERIKLETTNGSIGFMLFHKRWY